MSRKYFGTDGIRGRIGKHPMTPDFALRLGWAAGKVLSQGSNPLVVIGKDTRISGYMLESALQAGLVAAGVNIRLVGPMPTPAVAYLTRTFRASAGIVISASHNPYYDNGIKFFSANGTKLDDTVEEEIERHLEMDVQTVDSLNLGKAVRVDDAAGRYIEFCKRTLPARVSLKGLRIVVDCANGATYHVAPDVFRELGAEVIAINDEPDGVNINKECGATSLGSLQEAVKIYRANVGIALDGDGDRLMMVDEQGEVVDGDEIIAIIAKHRKDKNKLKGDVVGTLMSNLGLEKAMKSIGVGFRRANVGDRYVMEELRECGGIIGGENSGHIIARDRIETGDGIVAALQVLNAMIDTQFTLYDLKQIMIKYPQVLVNVPIKEKIDLDESDDIQQSVKDVEAELGVRGRVLLRASGTEPLIRVMVEGEEMAEIKVLADRIANVVRKTAA
ncbi:MAG: Phosphoglucosamine mutase (EC [uncultured Thiotrichaceae bacterium]|uniref:Phosphoglucosamine mutase n=1 Tax=uncultured Thiotrichaceae bacterium TaxID=298394 RepID=A0A6S6TLZ2_9GAMM|nr:MAG: Phosphoglucosamine mutase (EC [uncultured Thiotrichaceae bacterium]